MGSPRQGAVPGDTEAQPPQPGCGERDTSPTSLRVRWAVGSDATHPVLTQGECLMPAACLALVTVSSPPGHSAAPSALAPGRLRTRSQMAVASRSIIKWRRN